jgi:hypothetical protein
MASIFVIAPEYAGWLCQDGANDFSVDVGQAVVAALEFVGELMMVDSQAVQDCGVEVVDVDRVADDIVAVVVGFAVGDSATDASSGHPHREAAWVMVSTVVGGGEISLAVDRSTKLATPDDESVVE